jgi:predicted GNAT family acetyltransferase
MHPLDNPAWTALTTYQRHLSQGGDHARRYPADLTVIGAVGRPDRHALDELAALVAPDDWISLPSTLDGLVPLIRPPFSVSFTTTLVQMVCTRPVESPPGQTETIELTAMDVPEMLELADLTHPGPFRPGTYRLGTYLGIRVEGRLAAMGGQRMHLPGYRELSAICTHPDFRGRGYARTIVVRLIDAVFEEGLAPFLHFEDANRNARALYATLGFVERARLPLVVLQKA